MSKTKYNIFAKMTRLAAQGLGRSAAVSTDRVRRSALAGSEGLSQAYHTASQSKTGRQVLDAARVGAASGPARELAKICGRAGVAGAVVDGAIGGMNAAKYMRAGHIDGAQAARHVAAETGCGFVTSASGTAGTIAVYMVTGTMGPAAMVAGMGASMGSRYAYRKLVGDTLPDLEQAQKEQPDEGEEPRVARDNPLEDIGPKSKK